MTERRRLLHVFSTFATGGPQVRFATLANVLGDRFRHAVVAMDGDFAARARLDPALGVAFPAVGIARGDMLGNRRRFRAVLRVLQPDTLLTYNWGSIEWAMANRPRIVRHVHVEDGFGPEERERQLARRAWTRRIVLRGSMVVVPSRTLARIATEVWRLPARQVRYLPNGIDLSRFEVAAERWEGAGPVIGTVATLRAEKRIDRLIAAVRRLPEVRLLVIGDGPARAALERDAADLGPRVRFAGHVGEPAPLLRGLDLFALSSDTEQMPLSVLEAMAAGLPVVATDVGDVRAVLAPEQAPYVVAREAAALADAARTLLEDAGLRARVGEANLARVAGVFDQAAMVRAWDGVFAEDNCEKG
ncbi:MAG TPA: glycosyltransferase [Acetobacteraceae bacterium]|nr:glycosyltransferase [Acetobacteraceae bacterium]